jgi:hypothetical protein
MNDALKDPSHDLVLKLDWPNDQNHSANAQRVFVELQSANGIALAVISVPSDQLLQAVSQKLECYPLMSPEGLVSVVSDEAAEILPKNEPIALDHLIATGISSDMLDDEPNAMNMLSELRARLLKSLEHVEQAISSIRKP